MPKEKVLPQNTEFIKNSEQFISSNFRKQYLKFSARYEIIKDLGEGGIGRVYKVYDLWNKREIALKVLPAVRDNSLLESFKNEFLLLTQLRHPGVVEVFDFGYAKPSDDIEYLDHLRGEVPYFTMEFVESQTLHQSFDLLSSKDHTWLESERFYHFIWQIGDILEYIHLRGIVHCDLKPDNLKVTDRIFNLKLLDFGLSEAIGTKREKTTKGTLPYMAPEMFSDEPLDERTDLYSLGVILYELVTSRLPFFSDDPMKIVSGHLEQTPVPPTDLNPHVPEPLNQLILMLLEKSPSQRPQSASELKKFAIEHLQGNSKIAERKTFLTHLYSGELVAREDEKAQVEELLRKIVSSEGRGVLLVGEQGVGKSFFLKDLKIRSQFERMLYVDSNCLENQTKAYQPLIEILRKMKPFLGDCDSYSKEKLDQALGSILSKPQGKESSFAQEQFSTHQKIVESLISVSQIFPMVLAIDDLQWADGQTIRFLSDFGQNIEKSKIFLVCAFRSGMIKEESLLKKLTDGWREKRWCEYIKLDRFDYHKTVSFIRSKLKREEFPEGFFSYMHQHTSGNPFFLTEVLKYLLENQIIFQKDYVWEVDSEKLQQTSVPDSIESALLKNLERYDRKTLDLLNVVAVMGKKFDPELMTGLNLLGEKDLYNILSNLIKDQVFVKKESPLSGRLHYEFANQSLQSLLYQRLDEKRKVKLHGRMAKLLEESSLGEDEETIFEIGHHYLKGGQNEKAYRYSLLSAEKMAQRFANHEVLEYLGTAIETASKFRDKEEGARKKIEALMRRADFHKQIGELNQAVEDYKTILRLNKNSSNLKMIAEAYNDLGDTYRLKHDYKKGLACLKKALEIRQKLNDPLEVAHTLNNMGLLYWIDTQYQEALISYEKALDIYNKVEDKFHATSTLNNIGLIYWTQGQYEKAMKFFEDSLKIKKELGDKAEIARSLNNIGATCFYLGKYNEAIKCYLESLELNEQIKDKKEIALNLENLGDVHQKMGDFENALEYNERGLAIAQDIALPKRVGYILENMGEIQFWSGNYEKAYEYFNRAKKTAKEIEDKELQILVLVNLSKFFTFLNDDRKVEQLLEEAANVINTINDKRALIKVYQIKSNLCKKEKRFQEALTLLDQAIDLAKKLSAQEELLSLSLEYSKLYLDWGNIEKTQEFLKKASNSGLSRYILFQPEFHLISGKKEWMGGNLSLAKENFETALQLAEKLQNPELLWRTHHQLGKVFLSSHNIERAYHELETAGRILKGLSENIKDEELKQTYLKDREKEELLLDLKEVAKELIGET